MGPLSGSRSAGGAARRVTATVARLLVGRWVHEGGAAVPLEQAGVTVRCLLAQPRRSGRIQKETRVIVVELNDDEHQQEEEQEEGEEEGSKRRYGMNWKRVGDEEHEEDKQRDGITGGWRTRRRQQQAKGWYELEESRGWRP